MVAEEIGTANDIGAIEAASWEKINRAVMDSAQHHKVENGSVVRIDSTVTAALMHAPTDSSLLWDGVRVMVRVLRKLTSFVGWHAATSGAITAGGEEACVRDPVQPWPSQKGVELYRDLVKLTRATMA